MAWISVHESIDGPKLRELLKVLNCSKYEAVGILCFPWFWGLKNADKDGLILNADEEDISLYLHGAGRGCKIDSGRIVQALLKTGWIDKTPRGLVLHDWSMWQEQWYKAVERREKDAQRKKAERAKKSLETFENDNRSHSENEQTALFELDLQKPQKPTAEEPAKPKTRKVKEEKIDLSPVFIRMPLMDDTEFDVHQSMVDEWKNLYLAIDVEEELRKMRGWCLGHTQNRKTRKGVMRFITGWLCRAQDGARAKSPKDGKAEALDEKYRQISGDPYDKIEW